MPIEAKQTKMSQFRGEKGLLQGHIRRQVAHAPKALNSSVFLKTGEGGMWFVGAHFLESCVGIMFCTCPRKSGHRVPANLQQDKWSLLVCRFHVFISGCAWPLLSHVAFSGRSELGLRSSFGAQASHRSGFFCCRARAVGFVGCSPCGVESQLPRGMWHLPDQGSNLCSLQWQADS